MSSWCFRVVRQFENMIEKIYMTGIAGCDRYGEWIWFWVCAIVRAWLFVRPGFLTYTGDYFFVFLGASGFGSGKSDDLGGTIKARRTCSYCGRF